MLKKCYFLIISENGHHEFDVSDPREKGFTGVVRIVSFEEFDFGIREGEEYPDLAKVCLGQSPSDPDCYQRFRDEAACRKAEFVPIGPNY